MRTIKFETAMEMMNMALFTLCKVQPEEVLTDTEGAKQLCRDLFTSYCDVSGIVAVEDDEEEEEEGGEE